MKSKLFSLISSKSFIIGFFVGMLVASAVTIILLSLNSPSPNTQHLKGTMSDRQNIPIGTTGVILAVMGDISCPTYSGPEYIVQFTGYEDNVVCTGYHGLTDNQQVFILLYLNDCAHDIFVSAAAQ
jgi:hypothetical protein